MVPQHSVRVWTLNVWGVKCMINRPYYDTVNFPLSTDKNLQSLDGDLIIFSPSASAESPHIYRLLSNQRNTKKTRAKKNSNNNETQTNRSSLCKGVRHPLEMVKNLFLWPHTLDETKIQLLRIFSGPKMKKSREKYTWKKNSLHSLIFETEKKSSDL